MGEEDYIVYIDREVMVVCILLITLLVEVNLWVYFTLPGISNSCGFI